jgi:multicomponent Na+:H+ antiporter subunit A
VSLLLTLYAGAAFVGCAARRLGPRAFLVAGVAPLATLIWALLAARRLDSGAPPTERFRWAPDLGLDVVLRLDAFTLVMVVLISGTGTSVFAYAWRYFASGGDLGGLVANLVVFAGSMLGLVLSDNLLALFVFWELTSVTSYLLIGHNHRDASASAAARQALLTTGAAGLAMLAGFVVVAQRADTYSLAQIGADPPSGQLTVAMALVLLGAFAKSAQVPFHSWLPRAMAAPTPVSAYLHSATMVTAGVYLVARMSPVFASSAAWRPTVVAVGVTTMLVGAARALRQHDLKLLLAYGTISQLGLMTALFGIGTGHAVVAGVMVLVAQAVFKAALFMVAGVVHHQAGTRDIRQLGGLWREMPVVAAVAGLAAASMAGLPPLLGFAAKESVFEALTHDHLPGWEWVTVAALTGGSGLTVAYSARFLWGAFGGRQRAKPVARPGWTFVAPPAALAVLSLGAAHVDTLVVDGARALADVEAGTHVALWHGVGPALGLSALSIAIGVVLFVARHTVERAQAGLPSALDADRVYQGIVDAIGRVADRVTGIVQPGSLPVYLGVILITALVLPAPALIAAARGTSADFVVGPPLQVAIGTIVVGATIALVRSERRFAAVILLGAVGYGVAGLFMVQGAPDLALTQLLVETLTLVLFVLVLRHLPERFRSVPWSLGQPARIAVAAAVGLFVAGFGLVAAAARRAEPVSGAHLDLAYPEAGGRNVVNVILVDIRGFDTLGEITVVTVATLGMIGLVRAVRRERLHEPTAAGTARRSRPLYHPSPVLDVGVGALVHTLLVFSLFLLFGGHNRPGGGFIGGLVAGSAFVLQHVRGGDVTFRGQGAVTAEKLVGVGVGVAAGTGAASWLAGGQFLESGLFEADLPVIGDVKASSSLLFDVGVYLVVVGLVLGILRSLGRQRVNVA